MEKFSFLAKSGSGENHYTVDFVIEKGKMKVRCTCPAGRFGQFCKHKAGFLRGSDYYLVDETQANELARLADKVQRSEYLDMIIKLSKAQAAFEAAEGALKEAHKEAAQLMKKGFVVR